MRHVEIKRHLTVADIATVDELLDAAALTGGRRPLSDHLYLDLVNGGSDGFAAFIATEPDATHPVAYAQLSRGNDSSSFEVVVHPTHRAESATIGRELLESALDVLASDGGGIINWWVFEPTSTHRAIAKSTGMTVGRTLRQMRRPLPTGLDVTVTTRDFQPGADDDAWLLVNNTAFADHGEQGGWTLDTLSQRRGEDWFDPAGFRIHEVDGRMAAFCWTKAHPATESEAEVGEIYVIAVHPDFQGLGLGKQLTLAGLEHLSTTGIETALLYVDADNTAAITTYERLGFSVAATNTAFVKQVKASIDAPSSKPRDS